MRIQDLEAMGFEDLWNLHEELTKILAEKITAEKIELEKRLARLKGPSGGDQFGDALHNGGLSPPAAHRYAKVPPKYRNSSAPYETWSGRGKQPRWLTEALHSGHEIEEFRIKVSDRIPDKKE